MSRLNKHAILIGIDRYKDHPLKSSVSDVDAMSEVLEMPEYAFKVKKIVDSMASKLTIRQAIRELQEEKPDLVVFYFSGHGFRSELGVHLVTMDDEEYPEDAIRVDDTLRLLEKYVHETANVCIILDACYTGDSIQSEYRRIYNNLFKDFWIIASSNGLTFETSIGNHSLLTNTLLDGLTGEAVDRFGTVTTESIRSHLNTQLISENNKQVNIFGLSDFIVGSGFVSDGRITEQTNHKIRELEKKVAGYNITLKKFVRRVERDTEWLERGYVDESRRLAPIFDFYIRELNKDRLSASNIFADFRNQVLNAWTRMSQLRPGIKVSKGHIEKEIGSGGFGRVWKVRSEDGKNYAYKVCHAHILTEGRDNLRRFHRGYKSMQLLDDSSVVKVHTFTDAPYGFYMDFIDGPNWRELSLSTNQSLQTIVEHLIMVAQALQHAHDHKVMHRDVKPENILVAYNDEGQMEQSILTDFDLSWYSAATQVTSSARPMILTLKYASPEFATYPHKPLSKRPTTDIFSFGQLLFFAITGSDPEPSYSHIQNIQRFERSLEEQNPPANVAMILKQLYTECTRPTAAKRPQSMREVIAILQESRLFLRRSQQDIEISLRDFLHQVIFNIVGFNGVETHPIQMSLSSSKAKEAACQIESRTGNSMVIIRINEGSNGKVFHARLDCRLVHQLSFEHAKNFIYARSNKLKQISLGLSQHFEGTRFKITSGSVTPFQAHVNLKNIRRDNSGIIETMQLVQETIHLLEK